MNYRLLAVAEAELAEAAVWYETQAPGLGQEFLNEFESAMERIVEFPEAWRQIESFPCRAGETCVNCRRTGSRKRSGIL